MSDKKSERKNDPASPVNGGLSVLARLLGRQAAREAFDEIAAGQSANRLPKFQSDTVDG